MKKQLLLLSLLVCCSTASHAQALIALVFGKKISTEKVQVGLFLAEQNTWITGAGSSKPGIGLAIGAYTNVELGEFGARGWRFENYMVFKTPGGGHNLDMSNALADASITDEYTELNRQVTYFEITPMMRYDITSSWAVGAGPALEARLSAKDVYSKEDDKGSYEFTQKIKQYINPLAMGICADVEYRLLHGAPQGLKFNLRYTQGLTNIYKSSANLPNGKNIMVHFGVAIPIVSRSTVNGNNSAKAN